MKTETIAQASEKTDKGKRVKVQIYTPTHICAGYVYCPGQRRLLDVLNGVLAGELRVSDEFLPVSEAEMRSPDGTEATVQSVHINKANILFVKEIEDGQSRGLGGRVGHKPYPYVEKLAVGVKLYMPSYTLTGQMQCTKGQGVSDVLNSEMRFLPMTNVEICPSAGGSKSGVSFIAVNKGQIISLEELGFEL
ncbi:unnamed protein product [marine sediment metagenome]|uniref:Uncharacterized protein n=1 Tax=marine sediment metagenome TaxID=412755 RepID=X1F1X1_9ZZZZ